MRKKTTSLIRATGIAAIALGAWGLFPPLVSAWTTTLAIHARQCAWNSLFFEYYSLFIALLFSLLPLVKIFAGYWLIRMKTWARPFTILVFTLDFCVSFSSTIAFCIQCRLYRNSLALPELQEAAVQSRQDMWPVYISALVSLLFIAMLNRNSVKEALSQSKS